MIPPRSTSLLRSANELINRALAPYPDDLVITTKVWPRRDPSGEWWWAAPQQVRGQVEENLRQLGRDHLDVVNLRLPRRLATGSITEALAIAPVVCVQNAYGIGAPAAEREFLRACGE